MTEEQVAALADQFQDQIREIARDELTLSRSGRDALMLVAFVAAFALMCWFLREVDSRLDRIEQRLGIAAEQAK